MKTLIKKEKKQEKPNKQKQAQCCAKTSVAQAGCHD